MNPKRIAILGSTGSIGCQALEVIDDHQHLGVCALAAGGNWKLLAEQVQKYRPELVALADGDAADDLRHALPGGTELLTGPDAMTEMVRRCQADTVLTAIVGSAGLAPTLAAIEAGSSLAIANKETLVAAGGLVMPAARAAGVDVLPVDSEHSAIFQCLACGRADEVRRVVITSSGGALRDWSDENAAIAGVDDALNHPTWSMGRKITIDSATLMNKALEIIEAHWLFDLPADRISVLVHPESIIHSYVEYIDGSVIAQMSQPDMKLPIAIALNHPRRLTRDVPPLDLAAMGSLSFRPLTGRFARAVELGLRVVREGGLAGAALNGANEAAVEAFLSGQIAFGQVVELVEDILNRTPTSAELTLKALVATDQWARQEVRNRINSR
jgi:1-deoxy-D-xylulose-5-phosphate reductoisomerase